jgi:sterol desaturase/sphingolipid hydroxylase (fatty acid hydroxylase superfamily)
VSYPLALALISLLVAGLERVRPARRQAPLRPGLWSDVLYLVLNGHFLGVVIHGIATRHVLPRVDAALAVAGLQDAVHRSAAADWPLWVQVPVALVVIDLLQWCVHNLLHRVPWLWSLHKVHHSVRDGEMDWIVSFRFQWTEVVVYKLLQYVPLAWFGFSAEAAFVHAVVGTLVGHLNHANLDTAWGWGRYILNSPRMHLWHHDHDADGAGRNFGIIFSAWDWLFGTAWLPDHPPRRLGFPGDDALPRDVFGQAAWQAGAWLPEPVPRVVTAALGILLMAGVWALA